MKRKILLAVFSVIFVVVCALGLSACNARSGNGGGSGTNGTYFLYANDKLDKSQYITLNSGKWSDDDGANGTYKLNGTEIVFYAEVFSSNEEMYSGTLSNGVLTIKVFGTTYTYCKEGSTPANNGGTSSNTQYAVTYDANGGAFANGESTYVQTVNANTTLTAPVSPSHTGSAFGGWSTSKNSLNLWKFATDTVSGNLTLYAVWEEQSAAIVSADGATIDETSMSVFMLVDKDTDSVSLSNKIVCSSDSVWKLYYDKLGQTEIPTKIAAGKLGELSNGNNIFYIVVTSSNGSQVNVHISYSVTISYYDNKNNLLNTDSAFTGSQYSIDYTPTISGYTFNVWKNSAGTTVTTLTPYEAVKLYADCTANTYKIFYNANGGRGNVLPVNVQTGQSITLSNGNSFYRENFTLLNYNTKEDGKGINFDLGSTISNYDFAQDITLYAIWESHYTYTTVGDGIMITGLTKDLYELNIPATINDKRVIGIMNKAFEGNDKIVKVVIPDSVISIGNWAFLLCSSLTSVTMGDGVTTIGNYAFESCRSLTSITVPDSVTNIGEGAFQGCSSLTSVTIGIGVTKIGYDILRNSALESVYYRGTLQDWKNIKIEDRNADLGMATRYYYSETQPTEEGNYWHYDTDGITPIVW